MRDQAGSVPGGILSMLTKSRCVAVGVGQQQPAPGGTQLRGDHVGDGGGDLLHRGRGGERLAEAQQQPPEPPGVLGGDFGAPGPVRLLAGGVPLVGGQDLTGDVAEHGDAVAERSAGRRTPRRRRGGCRRRTRRGGS